MKMFWQFIVAVVANFVFLVSGSILALYYVFGSPYLPNSALKTSLEVGLPILCFFVACYMAWRKQQLSVQKLEAEIKKRNDDQPLYSLALVDDSNIIKELIKKVESKIKSAEVSKAKAPAPHPILGDFILPGRTSRADWQYYIEELNNYKVYMQSILDNDEYHIVNFILENKGHGDTNVNIELHFKGFTQITDFYDRKIQAKKPYEPSSYLGAIPDVNLSPANKLGNRREVQTDKASLVIIEVDRIRHDDKIWLHYDPIFIRKSNTKKEIEYSIKSDQLAATETRTIDFE